MNLRMGPAALTQIRVEGRNARAVISCARCGIFARFPAIESYMRIPLIAAHLICTLALAGPLLAQTQNSVTLVPLGVPSNIYTPEIQLGSATQPAIVTVPPIEAAVPVPEINVSNAPPASTALLSTRHFDFIVSPDDVVPGSIEDTSISLGEYARQLRAAKQRSPLPDAVPNAIGNPTNSK